MRHDEEQVALSKVRLGMHFGIGGAPVPASGWRKPALALDARRGLGSFDQSLGILL